MNAADFCCPSCGAELSVEDLFARALDHRAFMHLAAVSIPVGARVLQYIGLFAPAKNRLSIARKARLIVQLLPDLQRQAIAQGGRDWEAPLAAWAIAIDGMLAQRDKLRLPLTGHGYLYAVLQGMADKVERRDEEQLERDRRARPGARSDAGALLDELEPELAATQRAIAQKRGPFMSAADVLAANPHLRKGDSA